MSAAPPRSLVRKAAAEDLPEILAIESAWTTTPQWSAESFKAELDSDRAWLCVLEVDDRVAGYVCARFVPPEAQVLNVAVRPDTVGRGFGRKLMEHLHQEAVQRKCARAALEVSDRNSSAIQLYKGLGYRLVGQRPKYYNDGSNALLMEALLK